MRQNMAATAVEEPAAAATDLGFAAAGRTNPRDAPRKSGRRRPN
jgi:hypothetical protein